MNDDNAGKVLVPLDSLLATIERTLKRYVLTLEEARSRIEAHARDHVDYLAPPSSQELALIMQHLIAFAVQCEHTLSQQEQQ